MRLNFIKFSWFIDLKNHLKKWQEFSTLEIQCRLFFVYHRLHLFSLSYLFDLRTREATGRFSQPLPLFSSVMYYLLPTLTFTVLFLRLFHCWCRCLWFIIHASLFRRRCRCLSDLFWYVLAEMRRLFVLGL